MVQCEHLLGVPEQGPINCKEAIATYTSTLVGGSCGVQDRKPRVCVDYACLWRLGFGAEQDRPDKSLMLIDTIRSIEGACEARPLAPGHEQTEEALGTVLRISRDTGRVALMTDFYERKIVRAVGRPL